MSVVDVIYGVLLVHSYGVVLESIHHFDALHWMFVSILDENTFRAEVIVDWVDNL